MLQDARQIASGSTLNAAVCIIGAGAAGITIALELANTPLDVILLESGGLDYSSTTQGLARGAIAGLPYGELDGERLRYLGGCTNHWGGECRPLDEEDFLPRAWIPHSGWPIRLADLVPYLKRAARVVEIPGYDQFAAPDWDSTVKRFPPMAALRFEGDNVEPRVFENSPPTRFGQRYRADLENTGNVRVLLNANLTGFDTDDERKQVRTVKVACLNGPRFTVQAKTFIVATGAIENARILLAASGPDRQGFGNQYDLVGRYFHEHVAYQDVAMMLPARASSIEMHKTMLANGAVAAAFTQEAQAARELPNFTIFFDPQRSGSEPSSVRSLKTLVGKARIHKIPDHVLGHLREIMLDLPTVAKYAWHRASVGDEVVGYFDVTLLMEQIPNPDSRVRLRSERDALGMPLPELDWRLTDLDRAMLLKALDHTARQIGADGVGRMKLRIAEDGHDALEHMQNSHHPMGTTRMHDDPRQGVVDRDCKVHGMANLFVAGSSVFTNGGAACPTYNLVALSIRLADRIKAILS